VYILISTNYVNCYLIATSYDKLSTIAGSGHDTEVVLAHNFFPHIPYCFMWSNSVDNSVMFTAKTQQVTVFSNNKAARW